MSVTDCFGEDDIGFFNEEAAPCPPSVTWLWVPRPRDRTLLQSFCNVQPSRDFLLAGGFGLSETSVNTIVKHIEEVRPRRQSGSHGVLVQCVDVECTVSDLRAL